MSVPPAFDLQGLLAEDQWIRRLAQRLAGDAHAAEDLVQDAWVAALDARAEAPRPRALRPWMRGILRNLWSDAKRTRAAREQRELRVARDEALEPTSELVAELELRKQVAEALLALEEPYRSALYLRFFKDQSLATIARRQGIALSSAHERVQHGLARLRARLDQAHGGRRGAWSGGTPGAGEAAGVGKAVAEAIAMAGGLKLAASVLVIGGGLAWFLVERWSGAPRAELAAAAPEAPPPKYELLPSAAPLVRTTLPTEPAAEPPVAPVATGLVEPALFHGRVVDPAGAPVPLVAVGWTDQSSPSPSARSGPDGGFALEPGAGDTIHCLEPDLATLVPATRGQVGRRENPLVVVASRVDFAGVVLDPAGAPVAGASVAFRLRDELYLALGLHRGEHERGRWQTASDASGVFALEGVAGGERVFLEVTAKGFEWAKLDLPPHGDPSLVVTLRRNRGVLTLRGVVLDSRGAPFEGARVSAGEDIVRSGADGRFEVRLFELPEMTADDVQAAWRERQLVPGAELVALAPGLLPARAPLADIEPEAEIVLRLGERPESIAGRVLDPERAPIGGAVVWLRDPTPFGRELVSMSEGTSVAWNQTVEDELAGGFGKRGTQSDEHGAFELTGLIARSYELMVLRPETCELAGPFAAAAGSRAVELVLSHETRRGRVAGRVVSAGGQALVGVRISARRGVEGTNAHAEPPMRRRYEVETDAEGRFELGEIALEGTELVLEDPRFFLRTARLAQHADPAHLELVEPVLCELQVDLSDQPELADRLKVLDGEGHELETMESYGNAWAMDTEVSVSAGLSPVVLVRETAETLVLFRGPNEVLRRPLRLDPGERTTVRP